MEEMMVINKSRYKPQERVIYRNRSYVVHRRIYDPEQVTWVYTLGWEEEDHKEDVHERFIQQYVVQPPRS